MAGESPLPQRRRRWTPGNAAQVLWRVLTSRTLSLVLLLALAILAVLGTVFPQRPSGPGFAGQAVEEWQAALRGKYGPGMTALLQRLGLVDLYRTPLFQAVLAALAANGLACTLGRVPGRWRVLRGWARPAPPPQPFPPGLRVARFRATGEGPQVEAVVRRACRAVGLHPQVQQLGRGGALVAERGRWTALGTVVAHLALAVVGVGLFLTATQGERLRTPPLAPGQAHALPWKPEVLLQVLEFHIDRYPDGRPRAYRLEVALVQGQGAAGSAREMSLGAPAPLPGGGRAYLYGYGPAVQVEARARTGEVLLAGSSLPLAPSASASLPDGRTLLVERATVGPGTYHVQVWRGETLVGEGAGQARTPIALEGLEVTLLPAQYVVLELARDPGYPWVVGGVVAGLAGAAVAMAGRRQQLSAFWQEGELLLWTRESGSGSLGVRAWQRLVGEVSVSMGGPEEEEASGA